MRGSGSFEEIHPDDRERVRGIFHQTIATGVGQRAEFRFLLKDGAVRYVESQGSVMRDKHGQVTNVIVVSRDVTERKQAEEQFREQAALLGKAHDAICVMDLDQRILYWNKGAEFLYGWTAPEAIGQCASELLFKKDPSHLTIDGIVIVLTGLSCHQFPLVFWVSSWMLLCVLQMSFLRDTVCIHRHV